MPVDGLAKYDKASGHDLVLLLQSLDRSVFPLNYETLLREIEARGPTAASDVGDREVATFDSLPVLERRNVLRACMGRVFILLMQYAVFGGIATTFALGVVFEILTRSGVTVRTDVASGVRAVVLLALTFASYWAFTKWLLHAKVGEFTFALLRDVPERPDNSLEGSRDR